VFADVDAATLNLDPCAAAAALTSRTRALLPVHF
jgi:dTDP-4-amino-4,6-dideoxygalactose transaminase